MQISRCGVGSGDQLHTAGLDPDEQHPGYLDVDLAVQDLKAAIGALSVGDSKSAIEFAGRAFADIGEHLRS